MTYCIHRIPVIYPCEGIYIFCAIITIINFVIDESLFVVHDNINNVGDILIC